MEKVEKAEKVVIKEKEVTISLLEVNMYAYYLDPDHFGHPGSGSVQLNRSENLFNMLNAA